MKALTVGGAMIDTIAIIANDRIERIRMINADNSFLLLEEGRKTEALDVSTHVGGGAVNTAVAMARLGLDVGALVKLGKDAPGRDGPVAPDAGRASRRAGPLRDGRAPTGASVLDLLARPQRGHLHLPRRQHAAREGRPAQRGLRRRRRLRLVPEQRVGRRLPRHHRAAPRRRARWWPPTLACASCPRAAAPSRRRCRQIDILAVNRTEAGVLVPGLVTRFGEGARGLAGQAGRAAAPARRARLRRRRTRDGHWSISSPVCASSGPATWW